MADFYTTVFPDSKVKSASVIRNTPSGDCDIVSFELAGFNFMAISAGPLFTFNPTVSFILNFDPLKDSNILENIDALWSKLSQGGQILMPLQKYDFSERYGWSQDKYGVSWQIVPVQMNEMMSKGTREQIDRVTQAFLPMKKFDIAKLQEVYEGK